MRDPMTIPPEILAMLDKHEPDKTKQIMLLTEHLARQRTPSSSEEEMRQHLERKAKCELASTKAEAPRQEQARQAAASKKAQNIGVIATFTKRAKEAVIVAGATLEIAEAAATAAAA